MVAGGLHAQPRSLGGLLYVSLLYVSLFSMRLGLFARYGGLAMGDIVGVSQVQLLQPFPALPFAVPVLGRRLDPVSLPFALALIAIVFVSRRMPVGPPAGRQHPARRGRSAAPAKCRLRQPAPSG